MHKVQQKSGPGKNESHVTQAEVAMCNATHGLQLALDSIVIACDELGEAIAMAYDGSSLMTAGLLEPFLTLWRVRWELGLHGGKVEGAEPARRAAIAACHHGKAKSAKVRDIRPVKPEAAE